MAINNKSPYVFFELNEHRKETRRYKKIPIIARPIRLKSKQMRSTLSQIFFPVEVNEMQAKPNPNNLNPYCTQRACTTIIRKEANYNKHNDTLWNSFDINIQTNYKKFNKSKTRRELKDNYWKVLLSLKVE